MPRYESRRDPNKSLTKAKEEWGAAYSALRDSRVISNVNAYTGKPKINFEKVEEMSRWDLSRIMRLAGKAEEAYEHVGSKRGKEIADFFGYIQSSLEPYYLQKGPLTSRVMGIASLSLLVVSMFFLSFSFTGNAVSNLNIMGGLNYGMMGIVLFVVGSVFAVFYAVSNQRG